MNTLSDFEIKQRKYMPVFPKATGKPTPYIEGYPYEDDEPMAATGFHAEQIVTLADQFFRYFEINEHIFVGIDTFIYYREGDHRKVVAPDIYIVLGASKFPQRRSFYTWSEGAAPSVVFEFLSDSTAHQDRDEKVPLYLVDIGVQEYFIHQPDMERTAELRGWRRGSSGDIVEIAPDAEGGLFSETLNLYFRWKEDPVTEVRLLRPYLPDGTPITTSREDQALKEKALEQRQIAEEQRQAAEEQRQAAEEQRQAAEEQRQAAERRVREEQERRQAAEAELARLRAQLAHR